MPPLRVGDRVVCTKTAGFYQEGALGVVVQETEHEELKDCGAWVRLDGDKHRIHCSFLRKIDANQGDD